PQPRAEILGDVAHIYEATNQIDHAESVHRQVLELDPDDPTIALPASRALERIYTRTGRNEELARVLRAQVKVEEGPPATQELLGRLGKLAEEALSDDPAAIEAWRERLDDDPADAEALAALDRLYERAGDHKNLVEILRARERNADEPEKRKIFMSRAARA